MIRLIAPVDLARAKATIQRMRGVDARTDEHDYTAIYLAAVVEAVRPGLGMREIAEMCGYDWPDAIMFAELCELARGGTWMRREIVQAATVALQGRAQTAALTVSKRAVG